MKKETIIDNLKKKASSISEAYSFVDSPGIYAFFFRGRQFPLKNYKPTKNEIIYIGKTQSSGISRVLNTHFGTGKTGSSTVRRTLGALLREPLKLKAIPRNNTDITRGRLSFKFDDISEEKLTNWMSTNLLIAFYPLQQNVVPKFEKEIINFLQPVLNIEDNSDGQFYLYLKDIRKDCAERANNTTLEKKIKSKPKKDPPRNPRKQNVEIVKGNLGCLKFLFWWIIITFILMYLLT